MDIAHIERIVEESYAAHADAVIADLKAMGREHMQSGDDSPFQNVWEEFASQIQEEESVFWDMYVNMVRDLCDARVERMSPTEMKLHWFFTDAGWEWTFDIDYDKENDIARDPSDDIPATFDPDDVTETLYEKVREIAVNVELPSEEPDEEEEDEDEDEDEAEGEVVPDDDVKTETPGPPPQSSETLTLPLFS